MSQTHFTKAVAERAPNHTTALVPASATMCRPFDRRGLLLPCTAGFESVEAIRSSDSQRQPNNPDGSRRSGQTDSSLSFLADSNMFNHLSNTPTATTNGATNGAGSATGATTQPMSFQSMAPSASARVSGAATDTFGITRCGCGRDFSTPHGLKMHIVKRNCSAHRHNKGEEYEDEEPPKAAKRRRGGGANIPPPSGRIDGLMGLTSFVELNHGGR